MCRKQDALAEFTKYFAEKGIPESVSSQAYYFLQEELSIPRDFPLKPSDDLCVAFGVVDEDLEELVKGLAKALNRRLPPPSWGQAGKPMVYTIDDAISYVISLPVLSAGQWQQEA